MFMSLPSPSRKYIICRLLSSPYLINNATMPRHFTTHSWASILRRCFRFLDPIPGDRNSRTQTFLKKFRSHFWSRTSNNNRQEGDSRLRFHSGLVSSRIMVFGSSMGFCYWSLNPYTPGSNSAFSLADCQGESHTSGDDLLREIKNEKKQKFLFGGKSWKCVKRCI